GSAKSRLSLLTGAVGAPLALDWPEDAMEVDFRLRDPAGRERTLHVVRSEVSKPFVISGFEEPGLHRLSRQDRELTVAINIPEEETGLTYLAPDEVALALRSLPTYQAETWAEHQEHLAGIRHGKPLWPLLLCLAFLLSVTEELFANLRSRAVVLPEALRQFVKRGGRSG
ncbi:MAG: hypothetical protein JXR77_15290, partial [Lentisphaeria bacterium]|nr:hypothetical protein [Lentisphaeria bacterium]